MVFGAFAILFFALHLMPVHKQSLNYWIFKKISAREGSKPTVPYHVFLLPCINPCPLFFLQASKLAVPLWKN